jgi:hypothetical protein
VSLRITGMNEMPAGRTAPFVKALDIWDMAIPTEAAYSEGSSETLEQWILGTTSVCPGRSGSISVGEAWPLG